MRTNRSDQGFTLLEMVVTLAILGILMALALGGLQGLKPKATAASYQADLVGALAAARNQAMADDAYVYVRWVSSGTWKGYVVCEDPNDAYQPLATYDPAHPCDVCTAAGCPPPSLVDRQELPVMSSVVAGSAISAGSLTTLATPYQAAVVTGDINATGSSFSQVSKVGYVEFLPNGQVALSSNGTNTGANGGAIAFRADPPGGPKGEIHLVIITAPFGLIGSFDAN